MGHYKLFQFRQDVQYWYTNLSDEECVRGVLRFKEDIRADAYRDSKEALCLLIDLDNILNKLQLTKLDKNILKYYCSGFSNMNPKGEYETDCDIVGQMMDISPTLIDKKISKIVTMITEYNFNLWCRSISKRYKSWILKTPKDKQKLYINSKKYWKPKTISKIANQTYHTLKNEPAKDGEMYTRLSEYQKYASALETKKTKMEAEGKSVSKILDILMEVYKDIQIVKKHLGIQQKIVKIPKGNTDTGTRHQTRNKETLEYINEFELFYEGITPDSFIATFQAWKYLNIIQPKLRPIQRQIVWWAHVEGLSYQQIADKLEISIQAVKNKMHKIRKRSKEISKDINDEEL